MDYRTGPHSAASFSISAEVLLVSLAISAAVTLLASDAALSSSDIVPAASRRLSSICVAGESAVVEASPISVSEHLPLGETYTFDQSLNGAEPSNTTCGSFVF